MFKQATIASPIANGCDFAEEMQYQLLREDEWAVASAEASIELLK